MKFSSFYFASVLALSCLYLSSCKKTESTTAVVTPDLSSQMVGRYELQLVTITNSPAGVTIDPTSVSVSIESNNNALDAAKLTTAYSYSSINDTRKRVEYQQSKTIRLQPSGTDVALYDFDTKVGQWHKDTLTIFNYLLGSSTFNLSAVKR